MSISEWAKREVEIACDNLRQRSENEDDLQYDILCYESAMKAYETLMEDDHSGCSIVFTKNILNRLIDGRPLTPIYDTEDVWVEIEVPSRMPYYIARYQCKRMSSLFKYVLGNGEVGYTDIDRVSCFNIENPSVSYHCGLVDDIIDEMFPITMPYVATDKYDVYCEEFLTDEKNGDFDTIGILIAVKNDIKRIPIKRYFKEIDHQWVEITEEDYSERKLRSIVE